MKNKGLLKKLAIAKSKADAVLSKMDGRIKSNLEKSWDIEHAYYSSALEGSKLDRKEFEELGKEIK